MDWHELSAALERIPAEYRPVCLLMGCAGLRVSEACAVRWSDFVDGVLLVRYQIEVRGGARIKDILKTDSSYRDIPIPAELMDAMRCGRKGAFVGTNKAGRFYVRSNIQRVLGELGLPSPHKWRHTYGSLLANDLEAPKRVVDTLMGHAGVGVGDRYSHTFQRQLAKWQGLYYERLTSEQDKGQLRVESK